MSVPKYISAEEYAKRSGLSPKKVKDMCKVGKLDFYMIEGGFNKIKEDDNNSVSKELYEKVKEPKLNAETMKAIEDAEKEIGLSKGYTDLDEMWKDLEKENC